MISIVLVSGMLAGCEILKKEDPSLKIGLLPILDVLPIYVADQEGYFKEQGIQVELVPFGSAVERDTALQSGQIDGEINDLISAALLNKDEDRVRVVRIAMRATPDKAMFAILAADSSDIQSPADLAGAEIAISTNTVIEYVTDQILTAEGLAPENIAKTEVSKIPVRLELLDKGQVQAATLPEPLASLALKQGARLVVDDTTHTDVSQSIVSFRLQTIKDKPNTVKKFLAAYEKGVEALNSDPDSYYDLLIEKGRVPEPVQGSFTMPRFPAAEVTSEAEFQRVIDWMLAKDLLTEPIPYDRLVDGNFLPQ
jgi:NitT/TauT family transport system substrate-binding protein